MMEGEALDCFSAFCHGMAPDVSFFSGSCFHHGCFSSHALSDTVLRIHEQYNARKEYNCFACNEEIVSPEDIFPLGFLTKDQDDSLYDFNFRLFHGSCFALWPKKNWLLEQIAMRAPERADLQATLEFLNNKLASLRH